MKNKKVITLLPCIALLLSTDAAIRCMEEGYLKGYKLALEYIDDTGSTEGAPAAANYALDNYGCHVSQGEFDFGAYDNGIGLLSLNIGQWGDDYVQVKMYP